MTDLATLGIVIDSSQVPKAVSDLDKLTAAGTRAEAATNQLARTGATTSTATAAMASGAGTASLAMQSLGTNSHASSLQIRESLVLMREASVGNFTRMAASASLLGGSLANTGTSVGGLVKQLLTMAGVLKITQNAELAEAATQAAASAASIKAVSERVANSILAADTELALAEASARTATTAEAEAVAQAQLAAAHKAVSAAAADAVIAEDALAVAQGRAATAAEESAAATTTSLTGAGLAFGVLAVAAGVAYVAFKTFGGEAKHLTDELANVEFASNQLDKAEKDLGDFFDMTTGKAIKQTSALYDLAKAQLLVARVQAEARQLDARAGIVEGQRKGPGQALKDLIIQGPGSLFSDTPTAGISKRVLSGTNTASQALDQLESLRKSGTISAETFVKLSSAIANYGMETQNVTTINKELESLISGKLDPSLRKETDATHKSARAHKERAAGISEEEKAFEKQFAETERYIDSLTREVAEIGKTPEQIKQMEIARQRDAAATDAQRKAIDKLTVSRAILLALEDQKKKAKEWLSLSQDIEDALVEEQKKNEEALQRQRMDNIQTLADFYETAFHDGAKGIWRDFKNQGLRIIAEIAAAYTLAMINGQQTSLGGILSQINVGGGQFGLPGMLLGALLGGKGKKGAGSGLSLGAGTVGDFLGGGGGGVGEGSIGGTFGSGDFQLPNSRVSPIGAGGFGGSLGNILGGAGIGLAVGSAIGGTGASIGGALGGAAGMAIGGPIGALIGSVIGSGIGKLIGGLFKKTKTGSATLGFTAGDLGVGSTAGKNADRIASSSTAIGSVADALNQIASALGGTITGAGSVSIGIRKNDYIVDPTGQGRTKGSGLLHFGQDQEAAIRAAIADALSDGVIAGISDASKRILASGQKLETAIEKASLIEQIPKLLKQHLDPLGAALDDLNKQWDKVWAALKEGQATTEQYAQAQQLYNLELQDVKDNTKGASSALKDFLDSLNFGSNSPYSLMDQEAAAKAKLQPFLDQIATGGTVDQQKYLDTAQSFLDIERQLYGSTPQFFDALNMVKDSTSHLIDKIDNVTSIGSDALAQATADNTAQTASNTAAIGDMTSEQTALLQSNNDWLAQIAASIGADKNAGFIGGATGFASAA